MSESEPNGNGNGLARRWLDRAFIGIVALSISLAGFIWMTLSGSVSALEVEQKIHTQRITVTEQVGKEVLRRLERIEDKVDSIAEKHK